MKRLLDLAVEDCKLMAHLFLHKHRLQSLPDFMHERRVIFIHIPKAAGLSVATQLYGKDVGHYPAKSYLAIDKDSFKEFYKFTVVRNPWARVYSAYSFLLKGGMERQYRADGIASAYIKERFSNFEEFVMEGLSEVVVRNYIHFRPQSYFLYDRSGVCLVDDVFKLESKEVFGPGFKRKSGIELRDLVVNSSNSGAYADAYLNEDMISKVASVYKRDIDNFKYHFGD